jgi:hypothetical protein
MRATTFVATLCMTLLAALAPAQTVSYECDRVVDFTKYKTYAWSGGTEVADALTHQTIVRVIGASMQARGLTAVAGGAKPDALIAYHASLERDVEGGSDARGVGPFGIGSDAWASPKSHPILLGTLVVVISDARTGQVIWRSLASDAIRPGDTLKTRDAKIAKAARKMFRHYPPKQR